MDIKCKCGKEKAEQDEVCDDCFYWQQSDDLHPLDFSKEPPREDDLPEEEGDYDDEKPVEWTRDDDQTLQEWLDSIPLGS